MSLQFPPAIWSLLWCGPRSPLDPPLIRMFARQLWYHISYIQVQVRHRYGYVYPRCCLQKLQAVWALQHRAKAWEHNVASVANLANRPHTTLRWHHGDEPPDPCYPLAPSPNHSSPWLDTSDLERVGHEVSNLNHMEMKVIDSDRI